MNFDETYAVQIAGLFNNALAATPFEVTGIFNTLEGVQMWVLDPRNGQKYRIMIEAVKELNS